jgi:PAS domain S-box-containing protein
VTQLTRPEVADASRYERILDATFDGVFVIDPASLRVDYANRGLVDLLARNPESLLGRPPTTFLDDLDERALRRVADELRDVGATTSRSLTFRRADGTTFPSDVLFLRVAFDDGAERIVATARDVSDRLETQARLQRLAEAEHARAAELNAVIHALGDGVLVCGADGRVRIMNPAAAELLPGVRTYDDLLSRLDDAHAIAPSLGQAGGPVELRVLELADRWLELSTYPVPPRNVGVPGAGDETIVLLRDITLARRRQASRETFIHMLSHELRTPVTTIFGGAKVLTRPGGWLDQATRESLLADIHSEAERLHRLVEDVIALTRFGEDEGEVGSEPLLLQRVLPTVVRSEESRWPGVRFSIVTAPNLPTVTADRTYVEQVVRNLLSNAAKYAGANPEVTVVASHEGDEAIVRVLDNGPGFAADEGDRLFDLYYRSPRTSAGAAGAGIGLFVCARLIEAMGGHIWARPRPEGGAEFGFSLAAMADED